MPDTVTRPYFCIHCDDWADHPTHEHRKTSRRVGKRGKVVLIYLTAEALEAYQSIPGGDKSKVAQAAFIEYANNPTKKKRGKMNETGRKADFIFEDEKYTDPRTGVEVVNNLCFTVWADEKMKSIIQKVEGVTNVYTPLAKTHFHVYYDQRYDREAIKQEIAAAIRNAM